MDSLVWPDTGIVINEGHDRAQAIIRALPFVKDDEVRFDFQMPDTMRGRDACTSIRNKTLDRAQCASFKSLQEGRRDGLRIITQARLLRPLWLTLPPTAASTVEVREQGVTEDDLEILRWL